MKAITAITLVIVCSIASAVAIRRFDETERASAVAKAFDDGKTAGQENLRNQVINLKSQIETLVSPDEFLNQQKDIQLNAAISKLYNDGHTPTESADLQKAREAQAWHSLKYRIIFGQVSR